jgi:hypothetical protein
MHDETLTALAAYLSSAVTLADGRTYAGGLTKFEPKEMERLLVPSPTLLARPTEIDQCPYAGADSASVASSDAGR